jgi:O-antigen ligase
MTIVIVPLTVWPSVPEPFTRPRIALLAVAILVVASLLLLARQPWPGVPQWIEWSAVGCVGAVAVSATVAPVVSPVAVVIPVLGFAWAVLLRWVSPEPRQIVLAIVVSASIVAMWALLQFVGLDPLQAAGWLPDRAYVARMRVHASLGNPNFVGAYLASVLPLAASDVLPRRVQPVIWGLILFAIAATTSRGACVAALVGMAALTAARPSRRSLAALLATLLMASLVAGVGGGGTRSIDDTVHGRRYILDVAAPHLVERPLAGFGPGSFGLLYPGWEVEHWTSMGVDANVRRYAAAQRHAHNDYVELLSDLGVPALLCWLSLTIAVVAAGLRGRTVLGAAAAAGVVALSTVASVDFPLQRPVETFMWWTLAVLVVADCGPGSVPVRARAAVQPMTE